MSDCARGCLRSGQHTPDCTCTHECPDHAGHCEGCLPRRADIGGYCQKCADNLRDTLTSLPGLIFDVRPPDQGWNEDLPIHGTAVDQPSPSPALDTADEGARWLHSWALAVADERSERGPFEYRNDGTHEPHPYAEARYLADRVEHITTQTYANDLTDEARRLAAFLTRAAKLDDEDQRIPTRCPVCGQRALVRPNGAEHIECRNKSCNVVWHSPAQIAQLTKVVAS